MSAVAQARSTKLIEARDLVLSFGETPALRGASLTVPRGEIVAVMGPSGSGKSTLRRDGKVSTLIGADA